MNSIFFPIMICFLCFPSIFLANIAFRRTVDAMHDAMHQLSGNPRLYINIGKWKIWHQQCPKNNLESCCPPSVDFGCHQPSKPRKNAMFFDQDKLQHLSNGFQKVVQTQTIETKNMILKLQLGLIIFSIHSGSQRPPAPVDLARTSDFGLAVQLIASMLRMPETSGVQKNKEPWAVTEEDIHIDWKYCKAPTTHEIMYMHHTFSHGGRFEHIF